MTESAAMMSGDPVLGEMRGLRAIFWLVIVLWSMNAAFAIWNARDLVYDGSYYLLAIAAHSTFHLIEPARLSVQMLQQFPAVIAARLGIYDLWTLGRWFSLGMSGCPVLLTCLCWFALPQKEKTWIAGPLVNLVFAVPPASFIGIAEGIIASCLLWLAVFLVTFRLDQPLTAVAALTVSLACAVSHESAVLCLLLVAWLAAEQLPRLNGVPRITAGAVVAVTLFGALYMVRWIAAPRSAIERGDFLVSLFGGFLGSPKVPNLPAIASLIAALFIAIAFVARRYARLAAVVGSIAVSACALVFAAAPGALAAPGRYFAARGLPVVVTTVLATVFVLLRRRGVAALPILAPPCVAIFSALVFAQALMQAVTTNLWRDYVSDLRVLVGARHGVVSHAEAMVALSGYGNRFRRELLQSLSIQPLSVLLAPDGRVTAVVQPAGTERWIPFRFRGPKTLPRMPQLDWSAFQARPDSQ
jgi:hypothetical protein